LGTASVVNGMATLTIASLDAGPHAITADYSGDPGNQAVSSSPTFVTVAVPASLTLSPATFDFAGQAIRTSRPATLTLVNPGSSAVTVHSVTVSGSSPLLIGHTCSPVP